MGLLINNRKLDAAATSMHQFCQETRSIFPAGQANDDLVEAATVFLYLRTAQGLFGRRFSAALARRLKARLKYGAASDMKTTIQRFQERANHLERARLAQIDTRDADEVVRSHVTSVIESLLAEAGATMSDPEIIRNAYAKFELVIRDMKRHLSGIKEQNVFLMKRAG